MKHAVIGLMAFCCALCAMADKFDIVIYGSSPAAISAAVQAKRMGRTAVIVSPETRIGGLTTGGLGQTDIGNKAAFGGIALEFYRDVAKWYSRDAKKDVKGKEPESKWQFEPSAALAILEGWEKRDGLDIRRGERLDRERGVEKKDGRIVAIKTLAGNVFRGKVFVDATYEGDLMAAAGVSYTVGREANSVYNETIDGNQPELAIYHQLNKGIDPYVVAGDPSSGLLPGVEPFNPNEKPGDGDKRVQAYCFRMCLTDVPENQIPFKKPEGYDEKDYELLFRHLAIGPLGGNGMPWINSRMPNHKTDTNNRTGFSTDFIGANYDWPEASYEEREKIFAAHLKYQKGLMWTLANHPRVPEKIRKEVARWGTCKDEFLDGPGDGWQSQLYVREARRMVGEYVMTEANCRGKKIAQRPVAMGAYTMDSHHVRRYVGADGFVHNEGDVEVSHDEKKRRFPPYGIDYGALTPKRGECANLLVPVCVSSSHIAFGSIRMEPVFFALGQAAGTAASIAAVSGISVQDVPYKALCERLSADGQVVELDLRLKFLTFNIWGDYFKNPVAEREAGVEAAILKNKPDVVSLQEVTPNWYKSQMFDNLAKSGYVLVRGDEAAALKRAAFTGKKKANCINHEPLLYRKDRWNLLDSGVDFYHVTLQPEKSVTWAVLEDKTDKRKKFVAFATHFWWKSNGKESDTIRELNARHVLWLLADIRRKWGSTLPAILGGDLNSTENSIAHAMLRNGGFANAASTADVRSNHRSHHGDPKRDENGKLRGALRPPAEDLPERSIDHIYYTRGIHALRHDIITDQTVLDASDHSPVLLEFSL